MIQVTQETKDRTVKAIQQANSKEYKHQKACHALVNKVMDDVLSDPYWMELASQAVNNKQETVKRVWIVSSLFFGISRFISLFL